MSDFIRLIDPQKEEQLMTWCHIRNVPTGVTSNVYPVHWDKQIVEYQWHDKIVSQQKQSRWFEKIDENPLLGSPLLCVAGPQQNTLDQIALHLFLTALYHSNYHKSLPYWHTLHSSRGDSLRDYENTTMIPINFLVLSNVSHPLSNFKLEKIRDILTQYDNIPRLLILATDQPVQFFQKVLFMQPAKLIVVGGTHAAG